MVMDNICHLLNNFIHCSAYETVIFCWVMHEQQIIQQILSSLDLTDCDVLIISLVCSEAALTERLQRDIQAGIRQEDVLERSIRRIRLYDKLATVKIDVSEISAESAAQQIMAMGMP